MPSIAPRLSLATFLWALPALAVSAEEEPSGRLGLRFQSLEEGLLVTAVKPGMGAAEAGILPGTLIVSIESDDVTGNPDSPRRLLVGPADSTVTLKVVDPLATEPREVKVLRVLPQSSSRRSVPHRPAVVRAYRNAVRDKGRRSAIASAQKMVDESFGGLVPREAVGGSLASLMRRGDRFAQDVARVLATGAADDPALLQGLSRVLLQTGAPEEAAALLERRAELVEADLVLVDQQAVIDVGSSFQARALQIDALVQTGEQEVALELARDLLSTHRDDGVAALVGVAPPVVGAEWRAKLPPLAGFEVPLLDGSTWSSDAHSGKVVVVNFWATWCGPCKQELPELAELYQRRSSDIEVVAVSVDTGPADKVAAMAKDLQLPFSVGIDPHLTQTFQVSAFPAIRVIGVDGALHYSARGYSPAAMEKLDQAIDQAMEGAETGGAPVAAVWGPAAGQATLTRFFPVAGSAGVHASTDGIVVGVLGAAPVRLDPTTSRPAEASVASSRGMPSQKVGWIDGAVAADPGAVLVRKWDKDGEPEWLRRLPEPATDLVVHADVIWVSARDHTYAFDAGGRLLAEIDVALTDLAVGDSGVVGVGPTAALSATVVVEPAAIAPEAEDVPAPDGPAPDGDTLGDDPAEVPAPEPVVTIDFTVQERASPHFILSASGDLAGGVVRQVVRGHFGPKGAERVAVVRADDRLLVFDGEGQPALVVELRQAGDLVAVDFDGDGQDSLVVGVPDHGVAWIDLEVP